jgi:pullulanase/glycogen debranching enzyme
VTRATDRRGRITGARAAAASVTTTLAGVLAAAAPGISAVSAANDRAVVHGAARPAQHALADCDAPAFATVLHAASAGSPSEARAIWLDGRTVRWPGVAPDGTFRLHYSRRGAVRVDEAGRVRGDDGSIELAVEREPLAASTAAKFRHVADGVLLAVPANELASLRERHREQLVLVQHVDGRAVRATALQPAGAYDDLYAAAAAHGDLGATITARSDAGAAVAVTRFALWAPSAQAVSVCLQREDGVPAHAIAPLALDASTGVWSARFDGDLSGTHYRYVVDVHVRGTGVVRNRVADPWSLGLGADSLRSAVMDLAAPATKPPGWDEAPRPRPLAAQTDMSIYELHVRDFSRDDPTAPVALRGKYLAFTQDTAGRRSLQALAVAGLTDVHLLPAYDFSTVPERGCVEPAVSGGPADEAQQATIVAVAARDCFNWGYDPFHFTVPEGSYSTDPGDAARRIAEFRAMVQSLHAAGLRVGMDVVYNHTVHAGQHPQSVLDRIVPDYYHRLDAAGNVERSTCCANTATEHAMMARLMIDSAVVWARDYRIDSFRFDLMGHQPRAAMLELQRRVDAAAGRPVQLIGEGWNFGEVADGARFVQAAQLELANTGIATFSDRARDAVRGGGAGDRGTAMLERQGFATGLATSGDEAALRRAADLVHVGLAGSLRDYRWTRGDGTTVRLGDLDYAGQPAGYVAQPSEVVNYVENHDNQTLFDIAVLKLPLATSPEDRARAQVLALATVAFSQGIAYYHAGGELLRSKSLDRNSYDSGDWFNRLDWSGASNGFARGLPPKPDNGDDWPLLRPRLENASLVPTPELIDWTRRAFLDLLRIRASSTLFRLRTADDVQQRLTFLDTSATPAVIAARLDGRGYEGAAFGEVVYALNADGVAHEISAEALRGGAFRLHPIHVGAAGADARARAAQVDAERGVLTVPPLTAVVLVRD